MIRQLHRARCLAFLIALGTFLAVPVSAGAAETPATGYRLGIFPYLAARQTIEFYGPVAASMQAALGRHVALESMSGFPEFNAKMADQSYDIALIQPFDYPQFVEKLGYLPLAQLSVPLVSQFYVRNDSRYQKLEDLRGTAVAMPSAEAATTRMSLRALYDNKLIPGRDLEVRYFNSHDSCIQQVWAGTASACGTAKPPIEVFEQRMRAKLRAIHDTPPVPHVVFVAHPRVPAEHRARLQQLITGWSQNEDGRTLLKRLGFPGFVVPRPAEYAMMRNYNPLAMAPAVGNESLFGVFPYLPARQLAHQFAKALAAMNGAAGMSMELSTAGSFANFGKAVKAAKYDVIFVQPFDYALAAESGYLPLAGMRERLQAAFFVLEASPYRQLADLTGNTITMPPVDAAVSRLGRAALTQAGITPGRDVIINYVGNHDACIQTVQRGLAVACVSTVNTLESLPKDLVRGLRAVGQTDDIPGTLFMAHRRLPAKMREQLQAELVGWKNDQAGNKILQSLRTGDLIPVNVQDYQRLKRFEDSR